MTKEEFLTQPQFIDKYDIMNRYECCEAKANAIIRAIKCVSNRANLKGKVTVTDYDLWYNRYPNAVKQELTP